MTDAPRPVLFALSDGRGHTCQQVLQAALVQFPQTTCDVHLRPQVTTPAQVEQVVLEAALARGVIVYTLVEPRARQAIRRLAKQHLVPAVDVLGPVSAALRDHLDELPADVPGLLYQANRERFDMMSAIEYTLTHDDGQRPHDLEDAHVVLVGVSRAGKSSVAYYLGYHGVRTANVPLVPHVPPPRELLELDPQKVVALRINARRLLRVRQERMSRMGVDLEGYVDERSVNQELRRINALVDKHGWRGVNVSYKAVEEIAKEVISLCGLAARKPY